MFHGFFSCSCTVKTNTSDIGNYDNEEIIITNHSGSLCLPLSTPGVNDNPQDNVRNFNEFATFKPLPSDHFSRGDVTNIAPAIPAELNAFEVTGSLNDV